MTAIKKEMEQAAREYAKGIRVNQDRKRSCHEDFIAGANWMMDYLFGAIKGNEDERNGKAAEEDE